MKWFWISLLGLCVLMCSCRTKKLDSNVKDRTDVQSELAYMNTTIAADTTRTTYTEQISNVKVVKETTTHIVYDTDKNVVKEVTKTERSFVEDSQTDIIETEQKRVEVISHDSLKHIADVSNMVDTEVKEESIGAQESFGKWVGIGISLIIGLLLLYLWKKFRVS